MGGGKQLSGGNANRSEKKRTIGANYDWQAGRWRLTFWGELHGFRPQISSADFRRDRWSGAHCPDIKKRDCPEPFGSGLPICGAEGDGEDKFGADFCEGAELCERANADALWGLCALSGDC